MLADALTCSFRHQQYKRLLACESRVLYRLLVSLPFLCPYPFHNKQRKSKWAGEQRVTYTYAGGSSLHFSATSITCNSDLHSSLHSVPVQLLWWLHNELGKNRKGTLIRAICACVGTSQSNLPFCSSPELRSRIRRMEMRTVGYTSFIYIPGFVYDQSGKYLRADL